MLPDATSQPVMGVSILPEPRQVFSASLAQFRQRSPSITKSGLVVQTGIDATQTEQGLIELLAHLPQAVQIVQHGSASHWECSAGQGIGPTLSRSHWGSALVTLLGMLPFAETQQPVFSAGAQQQMNSTGSRHAGTP